MNSNPKDSPTIIRLYDGNDLAAVLAIQSRNPLASHWAPSDYETLTGDPSGLILVAATQAAPERVLGFASFRIVLDEAELLNIAVDPNHQRQGIGRALLVEGQRRLCALGVAQIFLEVRNSNAPAHALYQSLGFKLKSVRKDYYRDPPEDACILVLELPRATSNRP